MYEVKNVLSNLAKLTNSSTNKELADKLKVSYNTLNTWIKRNSIGFDYIYQIARDEDISLDAHFEKIKVKFEKLRLNSLI